MFNFNFAKCLNFSAALLMAGVSGADSAANEGAVLQDNSVAEAVREDKATTVSKNEEVPEYTLIIEKHQFRPAELTIPANTKVKLTINNRDATPEEFEMRSPRREKVIPANSTGQVFVGPLASGEYPFVGEFHQDVAKGKIIVK